MVQFDLLMGLQFLSFLVVYSPPPDTQRETIPHRRAPDPPHIRFFGYIFLKAIVISVQQQNETFSELLEAFSRVY